MKTKPRLAVVGCGYWGSKHVRVVDELLSAEMATAVDRRQAQLDYIRKTYDDVTISQDFEDVLADESIDGVILATPISTHYKLAREALLSGKHVLVEKPMATRVDECLDLIQIAEENGRSLMVGHTFEYHPAIRFMREMIRGGSLGKLHYVDTERLNLGLYQPDANVLWDLAPHDFSIIFYLIDEPLRTIAAVGNHHNLPGLEDVAFATMTYPDRIAAHLRVSWLSPSKVRRVTVVGSEAMAVFDDVVPEHKVKIYDKSFQPTQVGDTYDDFRSAYHDGDVMIPEIDDAEPLRLEVEDFVNSIVNGNRPISDGYSGLRVVAALEAATLAMDTRQHIEMRSVAETLGGNVPTPIPFPDHANEELGTLHAAG